MNQKRILVFGAGELQESIIKNAKELGLYVIGIDPNQNASAKKQLDEFYVVSGKDFYKTCEIVDSKKIDGIVTTATDKPLQMMARIAEKFGFAFPSSRAIELSTNKFLMKKAFLSKGVPCAKGEIYSSINEIIAVLNNLKYPVIIKPVDSSGSRGVKLCNTFHELKESFDESASFSSNKKVMVEEFLDGNEISVEAVIYDKIFTICQFTDKLITPPPYNVEMGHIQPSLITNHDKELTKEILFDAVDSLELNSCAIHAELKITHEGPKVIEIGARLGGDFITSHLVPLSTGINIEKAVCKIALGQKPDLEVLKNSVSMVKYFSFRDGIVKKINQINFPRSINIIRYNSEINVSDEIKRITNSLERYGQVIIEASSHAQILEDLKIVDEILLENIEIH